MSFSLRGRTVAYDNIAVGSASGKERNILASDPSSEPLRNELVVGGSTIGLERQILSTTAQTAELLG